MDTAMFRLCLGQCVAAAAVTLLLLLARPVDGQPGVVTFTGSSFMRLVGQVVDLRQPVGLSFRTCDYGTLLEQHGQADSLELDLLANGTLRLIVRAGDSTDWEVGAGAGLNDNRWHVAWLVYRLGRLTLQVDGQEAALVAAERPPVRPQVLTAQLAASDPLVGRNFRGCLLQGPGVSLADPAAEPYNVLQSQCTLPDTGTCEGYNSGEPSPCFSQPCRNGATCTPSDDNSSYTCNCTARYSGSSCEIDNGPLCASVRCQNGGLCREDWTGSRTVCLCPDGFSGPLCEVPVQACIVNPCHNNGRCALTNGIQKCTCSVGFTGQYCETAIDDCASPTRHCLHEGECIDKDNGFLCDCRGTGYDGERCENNVDECRSAPCQNGGTCFDQFPDYLSACPTGWQGQHCEQDVNECSVQPCLNGGKCANLPGSFRCACRAGFTGDTCATNIDDCATAECPENSECRDGVNGHDCVCVQGFTGLPPNCTRMSMCEPNPCLNSGLCRAQQGLPLCFCTNGFTGPTCNKPLDGTVETGAELVSDLTSTTPADTDDTESTEPPPAGRTTLASLQVQPRQQLSDSPCTPDPCLNNGTCSVDPPTGGFSCSCPEGYSGEICETAAICRPGVCQNNATCREQDGVPVCTCTDGFTGDRCETSTDPCSSGPCMNGADCVAIDSPDGQYYCECKPGFEGLSCENNIDDCRGVVCAPGEQCFDQVNSYDCRCPDGFSGQFCDHNIDDCAENPCQNNGTCVDTVNDYQCVCPPGYTGRNCTEDLDECEVNNPCVHGICQNTVGSYQCYCRPGFLGDHCNHDYDECLSRPCLNNGTCENLVNGYNCHCAAGFTGKNCDENINECVPYPCENNATCVDGIASFQCVCLPGFDGDLCQTNIDECESAPCLNNGTCIDGVNMFTCNCSDTGFYGDTCEVNIDDCAPQPCLHGSTCVDLVKDYQCQCYPGFEGKNCETDIAECELEPCQNGATCLEKSNHTLYNMGVPIPSLPDSYSYETAGGYLCLCPPGFTGADCEVNIDECASSPCLSGDCVDGINEYSCSCWAGYEGTHCETEIDECERFTPCVHGTCEDRVADYLCVCEPDYGGKNCSVQLTGCVDVTCLNGGTCLPYVLNETEHKFRCLCPPGFHGELCQQETTVSFAGRSYVQARSDDSADNYTLSLRFRTTLPDGLVAIGQGGSDTFFRLRLSAGRLNLFSSMQSDLGGLSVGQALNDAAWHQVLMSINGTTAALHVDGQTVSQPLRVSSREETRFAVTLLGHAAAGNLQPFVNTSGFVGCMQDISVDGATVVPSELQGADSGNITLGCPRQEQCVPNPCQNNGTCVDLWNQYRCDCPRPFLGSVCSKSVAAATFNHENSEGSLVTVEVDPTFGRSLGRFLDMSLFVRTRRPDGLLFYLGSSAAHVVNGLPTYLAAELADGQLQLLVKLSSDQEQLVEAEGPPLNDGVNNLVRVLWNDTSLRVFVNGEQRANVTVSVERDLAAEVLYLGDVPDAGRRRRRQVDERGVRPVFKGSLQDIRITNAAGQTRLVEFFPLNDPAVTLPPALGQVTNNQVLEGSVSDDTCRVQPCQNNGTCTVTWNDFSCTCPRGYKGHTCSDLEYCVWFECPLGSTCRDLADGHECLSNATFNGVNSTARYRASLADTTPLDSVSVVFRSRTDGVLLMATDGTAQVALTLTEAGAVDLTWDGGQVTLGQDQELLSGQWRQLVLRFNWSQVEPSVDGRVLPAVALPAPLGLDTLVRTGFVVLGSAEAGDTRSYFRGCMSEVRLGGVLLPFLPDQAVNSSASNRFLLQQPVQDVSANCTLCYQHECQHGGTCSDPSHVFDCTCPAGFNGTTCENNIDECLLGHECTNGATCVDGVNSYTCACVPGYAGDRCEINIDECASLPCQHGSTCTDQINNYTCTCTEEYIGRNCEQLKIVNCTHTPCQHGGTCENLYEGEVAVNYTCACPFGYEGRDCEVVTNFCQPDPCLNGATCASQEGVGYLCLCAPGFEGSTCEVNTDDCTPTSCQNGGVCVDQVNSFTCRCPEGWTGRQCESDIPECDSFPCQNDGNCTELPGSFQCTCPEEYCGRDCSLSNQCLLKPDVCKNGGLCVPFCDGDPDNYGIQNTTCQCFDDYYGQTCEDRSATAEIVMIVSPVLSILLLAAIVGLIIFTMMAKNKRATRGTYSPSRQEMFNPRMELGNMKKPPPEERLI